jgi:CTP:molybdopterin cytidylyltransferase MocA
VPRIVYIVLAAGSLTREGFTTVFDPIDGRSPLARVAEALGEREAFVVVPPECIDLACGQAPLALTIVNDQPDRGLSYSLKVALAAIPEDRDFAILYGDDTVHTETLDRLEKAFTSETDVVFPIGGMSAYPILFSAAARPSVKALADGDTVEQLLDATTLRRVGVDV